MKKVFLSFLIIVTGFKSVLASDDRIRSGVLNAFKRKFPAAREVSWQANDRYSKATFLHNGIWMMAWYAETGKYLGLTRHISSLQLPLCLQTSLEKKFPGYWITDLIEESENNGARYYVTIEDADNKMILQSKQGGDWTIYSTQQK